MELSLMVAQLKAEEASIAKTLKERNEAASFPAWCSGSGN